MKKIKVVFLSLIFMFSAVSAKAEICNPSSADYESCLANGGSASTTATCDPYSADYETCLANGGTASSSSTSSGSLSGGGTTSTGTLSGGGSATSGIYIPGSEIGLPAPSGGISEILKNLLVWMLEIIGIIALIGFVISGAQYIIASGDEDLIGTAKRHMTWSIVGVIVVLASFVIIQAIQYVLEAKSLF